MTDRDQPEAPAPPPAEPPAAAEPSEQPESAPAEPAALVLTAPPDLASSEVEPVSTQSDDSEPLVTRETLADMRRRPSFVFFGIISSISLLLDIASKAWAEVVLSARTIEDPSIVLLDNHLLFTLAYNRGGAWGLLHDASEALRRPFFLGVSLLAIAFIVSLYSRLAPGQRALKWGLPCVLGGALGNLSDRIIRGSVVDFIDYRADWVESMNRGIAKVFQGWTITDHWPTFNVADVFICIGVGLMAVDMITSRRKPEPKAAPAAAPPDPVGPAPSTPETAPERTS